MRQIKKVGVLGAGVMGHGIAAHLAGAGVPVLLLDIVPPKFSEADQKAGLTEKSPAFRNKFALAGIEAIKKSKPAVIYTQRDLKLITPGNFEDDWDKLKDCDWIVEVVVERLDIKQQVFAKVEKVMQPHTIVSSNTSGLPLHSMAEGRGEPFKKNFVVTHFFNPVRYLKLVEVISSPATDPAVTKDIVDFLEDKLGKGVVYAKDTPNFIANRIGTFAFMAALKRVIEEGWKLEEVDKILGPALGKPKSAMFRTADIAGIDTLAHVVKNTYDNCPKDEQHAIFVMPDIVNQMIAKGWTGDKAGQGFYKKEKSAEGKKILSLDLKTGEYVPQVEVKFASLKAAKGIEDVGQRIKAVLAGDDKAADFAWKVTRDTLIYSANRIPEIADDVVNVDRAMRWGFNWDIGPFEVLDAIGLKEAVERIKKDGLPVPALFTQVLEKGEGVFYQRKDGKTFYFDLKTNSYQPVPVRPNILLLKNLREQNKVIESNGSASLIDVGDGVICLEFHSKMNAIDDEIIAMGFKGLEKVKNENLAGMVITNESENFSVGANLMLLWLEAQQGNWDRIGQIVKAFQDFCMALKYSPKPVVAAPFGLTLGGGCEVVMGADAVRAAAETYIGLVEVGVGLIPGGGGCKNMLLNCEATLRKKGQKVWASTGDGGPFPKVQRAFERVGFAKVATSAKEGVELDYLRPSDKFSLNRETLLFDAKQDVLAMSKDYKPATPREDILVPGIGGKMAMVSAIRGFRALNQISEHDAFIAEKLAGVLCGGDIPTQRLVSEQYLLDLEREAFLQLAGTEKSQARMQFMLMNNKPLRN
ncbi:MAG TPA: 3-hydroxyacyl-CoA dehydrogenase NAD-binding domain-containing protein [bacterium]|nr:3-hydroxyacyl-CoA dehydrogenase NAD-binding domain-containing protein [bacterium]